MVIVNLAFTASELQRLTTKLCDRCEDAERYDVTSKVAQAAALLADVAGTLEAREAKAHTRWSTADDDHLATYWGPALREFRGDTEAAVAQLAADVKRSPVAVAARLVKTGVWS
jgi:hypothetical protein